MSQAAQLYGEPPAVSKGTGAEAKAQVLTGSLQLPALAKASDCSFLFCSKRPGEMKNSVTREQNFFREGLQCRPLYLYQELRDQKKTPNSALGPAQEQTHPGCYQDGAEDTAQMRTRLISEKKAHILVRLLTTCYKLESLAKRELRLRKMPSLH